MILDLNEDGQGGTSKMLDLTIDVLNLQMTNTAGQEHRARPIARRAMELLADGLMERWAAVERLPKRVNIEGLRVPTVDLSLATLSDEQAAAMIAQAIRAALLKLEV